MSTGLTRRAVLGATGAFLAAPRRALLPRPASQEQPFLISLAQWSLHRALRSGEESHLGFPRIAREEFGLEAIELVSTFFKEDATRFQSLRELSAAAADQDVRILLIMIDGEGELGAADDAARRQAVEKHFKWIAAAAYLGCHSIRVNAGGEQHDPEALAVRAADSLVRLGDFADPYGIDVIVENHGGLSSDGGWLAGVMRRANHSRVGTLPDFGNFRIEGERWYDRYQGVAELMPFARAVSAKSHDFDAEGNETHTDYRRMLKIVLDAGYRGYVGIEYEGDGLPEKQGIAKTKALLERVREEM